MTDKELKKLSRGELLEMLIAQSRQLQTLQKKLAEAESALGEREIAINNAGSLAEAALQLNGVFEAAQAACKQYMDNICALSQKQEKICAQMENESIEKSKNIIDEAMKKKEALERETEKNCTEMVQNAKHQSQAYWNEVSAKLNAFVEEHSELQQLLSLSIPQGGELAYETK